MCINVVLSTITAAGNCADAAHRENVMHAISSRALGTRALGTLALAAAIVSAAGSQAWAKPGFAIVHLSPATFVSNCQSLGGTSSSAPNGGIRCTLANGQVVDCSFNTSDGSAVCQWTRPLPPKSAKALMGDLPPASMAPPTTTTKPPKATDTPAVDTVN
jgi:hypothetical protein